MRWDCGLQGVLDELLLDRGGALDAALVADVGRTSARRDATDVDPAVGAQKRLSSIDDHRLLDDLRDLARG